jgi:hypothetical protein
MTDDSEPQIIEAYTYTIEDLNMMMKKLSYKILY